MEKVMALILALVLCLGLCACGSGEDSTPVEKETEAPEETVKQEEVMPAYRFDGTPTGDITLEEVVVRPHKVGHDGTLFFDWEMKVRNTSGTDTVPEESVMRVWFRYLDENGDVIDESLGEAGSYAPVKNGQAQWIQMNGRLSTMDSSEVEATAFIEFYATSSIPRKRPSEYFEETIVVDIREFVKE